MKLRDRDCHADYFGHYPHSHEVFHVRDRMILDRKALKQVPDHPFMMMQYVHFLADLHTTPEGHRPEIYVYVSEGNGCSREMRLIFC